MFIGQKPKEHAGSKTLTRAHVMRNLMSFQQLHSAWYIQMLICYVRLMLLTYSFPDRLPLRR